MVSGNDAHVHVGKVRFAKNRGICYSSTYHIISSSFVSRLKHFNDQKRQEKYPEKGCQQASREGLIYLRIGCSFEPVLRENMRPWRNGRRASFRY